jgi:hypothetical protein
VRGINSVADIAIGIVICCNEFAQSVSRQRLGKHVPTCNSERCVSVDEYYSSLLGNSQGANEVAGYESRHLFSVLSMRSLYDEDLLPIGPRPPTEAQTEAQKIMARNPRSSMQDSTELGH